MPNAHNVNPILQIFIENITIDNIVYLKKKTCPSNQNSKELLPADLQQTVFFG